MKVKSKEDTKGKPADPGAAGADPKAAAETAAPPAKQDAAPKAAAADALNKGKAVLAAAARGCARAGKAAAKACARAGKAAARACRRAGKAIAKACSRAGKAIATACRHMGSLLGPLLKRAGRALVRLLKRAGRALVCLLKRAGRTLIRLLKRAGRWLKENFRVKPSEAGRIALNGLLRQNPTFVLLVGLCPALATTTSLQGGLGMGLTTLAVLVCSNLVISLLRRVIPREIRVVCHLVVIATFVTAADLLLQAFLPGLSASLGLYVPLIAVNCLILGRAEVFASKNRPGPSLLDGLFMGLGFTVALAILGALREVLGAGTIWGVAVPVLNDYPVGLILSPAGGFLTLGCLAALVQWLRSRPWKGGQKA